MHCKGYLKKVTLKKKPPTLVENNEHVKAGTKKLKQRGGSGENVAINVT